MLVLAGILVAWSAGGAAVLVLCRSCAIGDAHLGSEADLLDPGAR